MIDDKLLQEPILLISKLRDTQATEFKLSDSDTPWVADLFKQVKKDYEPESIPEGFEKLNVSLTLTRDSDSTFGEFLFVEGALQGSFMATCVKCLEDAPQNFDAEFKGAYINQHFENQPEYEEVEQIYIKKEEADVYFHEKGKANLSEILAEACFLAVDQYPLHDENCKGLCHTCGANLNNESCGH